MINLICIPASAGAQVSTPSGSLETHVSAIVGEFTLTVSGFVAPYASVVLKSTAEVFMASTVADAQGNFSFSPIPIQEGFSGFCLTAVDFRQLGQSTTCFPIQPASNSIVMTGLFLSPTLGLSRTEIDAGSTASAFGYTMPGASVTIYITQTQTIHTVADANGYYEINLQNLPAGQYSLYALAQSNGKESIPPTKQVQLKVLSSAQKTSRTFKNLLDRVVNLITTIWFVPLLIGISLLILIIILILKLWPGLTRHLPAVPGGRSKDNKLHHWWFIGY